MDYNSTTPVDEEVLREMLPYFSVKFGNASSKHHYGSEAAAAVENARKKIAALIGVSSDEIVFTSGATESVNLAIKGIAESNFRDGCNIVTTEIEHPAVLDTCKSLSESGVEIRYAKPDRYGIVGAEEIEELTDGNTILVSVMTANNETGAIQHIPEIGTICAKKNVLFHTDAVQAYGKIPINAKEFGIDLMSFSSHKIYGPKGVGALYINKSNPKAKAAPQMHGGGHEKGLRSGTLNVPGIAGFGKAAEIAGIRMYDDFVKQTVLRDRLIENLLMRLPHVYLNGHRSKRIPNTANICFEGVPAVTLMNSIKDVAVSAGSACASATLQDSHVLKSMGLPAERIRSSVRFSIGRMTTNEEIDEVMEKFIYTVKKLRN
ncbi:MAG: cysteine desulfurase [Bacteroidetes bacterium]|nr:cysteine desulfurase [Bacteroidota bacterium]